MGGEGGDEARLEFSASLGGLLAHDASVCCLQNRYLAKNSPSEPETPLTPEEHAAACKARDEAPPVGELGGLGAHEDLRHGERSAARRGTS